MRMSVVRKFGESCITHHEGNVDVKDCHHATKKLAKHILEKIFTHHGINAARAALSQKHRELLKMRREAVTEWDALHNKPVPLQAKKLLGIMYDQVPQENHIGINLTDDQFKSVMKLMEEEWGKLVKKDFDHDGNLTPREFEAYLAESATTAEWLEMQTRRDHQEALDMWDEPMEVGSNRMWVYGLGAYALLLTVLAGWLYCKLSKIGSKLQTIYAMDNIEEVTAPRGKTVDEGKETQAISLQKTGKYDFATIS